MKKEKLILPVSILLGCVILGGFFYFSQVNKQKSIEKQQQIDLKERQATEQADLQVKCADLALKYLKSSGSEDGNGVLFSHENHFNSKLNKCFVLVYSYTNLYVGDSFETINLYDATEGKHYAEFDGDFNCDSSGPLGCKLNAGHIWYNGNEKKGLPSDLEINEGEKTRQQFLDHIWSFMND